MPNIVPIEEVYAHLDITAGDDEGSVVPAILASIEDLLEEMTGRVFGPSATIADEQQSGHGTNVLYVERPIASVQSVKFRYFEPNDYDDVISLDNIKFIPGKRKIVMPYRKFPCGDLNVLVSYTSVADLPGLAKQAVKDAVSVIYRRRGSEDARSEQIGTFQHVMLRNLDESMTWKKAVELLHIPSIG